VQHRWSPGASAGEYFQPGRKRPGILGSFEHEGEDMFAKPRRKRRGSDQPLKRPAGITAAEALRANIKSVREGLSVQHRWSPGASAGGATSP
jgi:hypothetical protein